MCIRLKKIIKIGLPLIIFLINILKCSAIEENEKEDENNQKKRAIFSFLRDQSSNYGYFINEISPSILERILNEYFNIYFYYDNKEGKYKVNENSKVFLLGIFVSLLEEAKKKEEKKNEDNEQYCTYKCRKKDHMMKLPSCKKKYCRYAFYEHLISKLLYTENTIIPCPIVENKHICSFVLGAVKIKEAYEYGLNTSHKEVVFNKDLDNFLCMFGQTKIGKEKITLSEVLKKRILGGAEDIEFSTGKIKSCMFCRELLLKKNCDEKTNKIYCSKCKCWICFKCLCHWDNPKINHDKCIDSSDCDLYEKYGTGIVYIGEKNKEKSGKDCYENFKKNIYYHPRRCYHCKVYSAKDRQCNHVGCICGRQWCWFCGNPYSDEHWNKNGYCKGMHLEGDFQVSNGNSKINNMQLLNLKMQLNEDDWFPWERKKNKIRKWKIKNFIRLKKNEQINQLCCDCFLDFLEEIND